MLTRSRTGEVDLPKDRTEGADFNAMRLPPSRLRRVNRASWGAVAVAAALGIAMPAVTGAQDVVKTGSACALPTPAHDSVHVVVTAVAKVDSTNEDDLRTLPTDFLPYVVEAVRIHFTPPARLDLLSLADGMPVPTSRWSDHADMRPAAQGPRRATPLLAVDAYFTLDSKRAPRDVVIGRASMNHALGERIAAAIAAITPGDYGLLPQDADGVRIHLHVGAIPFDTPTEQPFFATWLPVYQVQHLASALPPFTQPVYPSAARSVGVGDSVVTGFVIGADGHAIPGTIDILAARFKDFIDPVVSAILHNRYDPAVAEGCAVSSTVNQYFSFTIR